MATTPETLDDCVSEKIVHTLSKFLNKSTYACGGSIKVTHPGR
jgi:hypothetical protein